MNDESTDADAVDINLRSAAEVARRMIIANAVIRRIGMDAHLADDAFAQAFDLREWLRAEGLWDDATAGEQAQLSERPGSFGPGDVSDLLWQAEGLATLAWTLGIVPRLSIGAPLDILAVVQDIPEPWEKTAPWISAQSLRSEGTIAAMRTLVELWFWRLDIEPERRVLEGRALMALERTIREVTHEAMTAGYLERGKHGGFVMDGVPVARMDPDFIDDAAMLEMERLMALNWVCGYGEDWDSVPLDV